MSTRVSTPSARAVSKCCHEVAYILMDSGLGDGREDELADKPLAAASLIHHKIAQMLSDASPDTRATALRNAILRSHDATFGLLMRQDVNFNAQSEDKSTLMLLAAVCERQDMMLRLIDKGADSSTANNISLTPLHAAAFHEMEGTIYRILNMSIYTNPVNTIGETPLHRAVQEDNVDIAICLLEHGADPCTPDIYDKSASEWAVGTYLRNRFVPDMNHNPKVISKQHRVKKLSKSVVQLSKAIITLDRWLYYGDYLGRCLTFLGDDKNAIIYFSQRLANPKDHSSSWTIGAACGHCGGIIKSTFFVCRVCPEIDYCAECMRKGNVCRTHDFLKVDSTAASESSLPGTPHSSTILLRETPVNWLEGLLEHYSSLAENEETADFKVDAKELSGANSFPESKSASRPDDSTAHSQDSTALAIRPVAPGRTLQQLGLRSASFLGLWVHNSFLTGAAQMTQHVQDPNKDEESELD